MATIYTITVHGTDKKPFHKADIRQIYYHHATGKRPTLWGHYGFYLSTKEAQLPMKWLKTLGFTKVELGKS